MDFLYKLYENQYFGIVLFSIIAVLLVLFIVVLFAAMRDSKKRKEETMNSLDDMKEKDLAQVDNKATAVSEEPVQKEDTVAFAEEGKVTNLEATDIDIVLDEPEAENSMSSLLGEFDKPEANIPNEDIDLEALMAQVTADQNDKKEANTLYEDADLDEDFELPAIKKADEVNDEVPALKEEGSNDRDVSFNETKIDIDLGKTGVLDFANVETESYDIKK